MPTRELKIRWSPEMEALRNIVCDHAEESRKAQEAERECHAGWPPGIDDINEMMQHLDELTSKPVVYTIRWYDPTTDQTGDMKPTETDPLATCRDGARAVMKWHHIRNPERIYWLAANWVPLSKVIVL